MIRKNLLALCSLHLFSFSLWGLDAVVSTLNVDAAGGLRAAINAINGTADSTNTLSINLSSAPTLPPTFTWAAGSFNLPPIFIPAGTNLTINGEVMQGTTDYGRATLDGTLGPYRGFIVESGNVILNNIILDNLTAQGGHGGNGGAGGGGGLGAGGALFLGDPNATGSTLTIGNVTIGSTSALGGNGGNEGGPGAGGGGGGMGGIGGGVIGANPGGGGGGGGLFGNGGIGFGDGGGGGGGLFGNGGASTDIDAGAPGGGGSGRPSPFGGNGQQGTFDPMDDIGAGGDGGGNDAGVIIMGGGGSDGGDGQDGGLNTGGGGAAPDLFDNGAAGGAGGFNGGGGGGVPGAEDFNAGDGGKGGINGGGGGSGGCIATLNANAGNPGIGGYGSGGGGLGTANNSTNVAGAGGFGGGGGGSSFVSSFGAKGAAGGFGSGGGGGGASGAGGVGGQFGGSGGNGGGGGGGGGSGAGLGGAFFIQSGTTFTFGDGIVFNGANSVTAGTVGTGSNPGTIGSALGPTVFLHSGGTLRYNSLSGTSSTIFSLAGGGGGSGGGVVLPSTNTGTLILTGTSTYTGTTVVQGGTLQGSTTSLIMDIPLSNNAQVIFDQSTTAAFAHVVSGTGNVQKINSGVLQLSNTNTYIGTTTISDGEIQASAASVFSPNSSFVVNVGTTLDLNSFNQSILGLTGAGTVSLGTAQLTINPTQDSVFSGNVTDTSTGGILIKAGTATQTFSGTVSARAGITISAGRLNANGNITGAITVDGGATLGGIGILHSPVNVLSNGNVTPGNSIGNLTGTEFTFNPGSFLNIQVSSSAASEIIANGSPGTVTITGSTLNIIPLGSFPSSFSNTYPIITAANGVSGTFASISIPPRSQAQVIYSPDEVLLSLEILFSFAEIVTQGNAGAVARAFDQLNPNDPDVQFLTDFLNAASASQLQCDFDQMQPALFNAIPIVSESAMTSVRKTLSDRMEEIHEGKCKIAVVENDLNPPTSVTPHEIHDYAQQLKKVKKAQKGKRTGIWITPLGNFDRQQSRSQDNQCDQTKIGFKADSYGTALGVDRLIGNHIALGGALSYMHTQLDWKESQAHAHSNSLFASVFSTFYNSRGYVDLAFTGAFDWVHAKRNIYLVNEISRLKRAAAHHNRAEEWDMHVGSGFTLTLGQCWEFRPFFTMDYIYVHEDGYKEKGAKSIDLHVNAKNSNLLRDELGASLGYKRDSKTFIWSPELKLSYVRESRFKGKHTHAQFVHSSAGFEVSGFLPDRNLISPGATLNLIWPQRHFSIAMRYNGEFADHWYNQIGSAEFLWRF